MVYSKTNKPPLRWICNLGHVIAREKGLNKETPLAEIRFILELCRVVIVEHFRLRECIRFRDFCTMLGWLAHSIKRYGIGDKT